MTFRMKGNGVIGDGGGELETKGGDFNPLCRLCRQYPQDRGSLP